MTLLVEATRLRDVEAIITEWQEEAQKYTSMADDSTLCNHSATVWYRARAHQLNLCAYTLGKSLS